jgi:NAD(P) transhydrogenase subunit beta
MGRASNRSFLDLAFGSADLERDGYRNVRTCGPEEAAMVLESASNLLIVPGFGMASAQAHQAVKQLADALEKRGTRVRFAVLPSAGCVPGHINYVLDQANIPHSAIAGIEEANQLARSADVVLCLGANDVVNPATDDASSPIFGMPKLDLSQTRAVFVVKRGMGQGATGAKNPLFEAPQTTMVFGDAKRVTQQLVTVLSGGGH